MLLSRLLLVFSMDQIPMSSFSSWLFDHEDRDGPGQKFLLVLALLGNKTAFTFSGKEEEEVEARLSPTRAQNEQVHKFTLRVIWASRNMDLGCPQLWKFKKFIIFKASWVQIWTWVVHSFGNSRSFIMFLA